MRCTPAARPSNSTNTKDKVRSVEVRKIRLHEHLAKLFELLRTPDFLGEQGELYDMEKLVVELMGFSEIFLLHLLTHFAMLAVGCCIRVVIVVSMCGVK